MARFPAAITVSNTRSDRKELFKPSHTGVFKRGIANVMATLIALQDIPLILRWQLCSYIELSHEDATCESLIGQILSGYCVRRLDNSVGQYNVLLWLQSLV